MNQNLEISYQREDDILFVLETGVDPNETWNLELGKHWTVRLTKNAERAVGYVITNAGNEQPKAVAAWLNSDHQELVKQYFENKLGELNKILDEAKKDASEKAVRQAQSAQKKDLVLA